MLMSVRSNSTLDWVCKQMDHVVGLSFSTDFSFALAAHVVKGAKFYTFDEFKCNFLDFFFPHMKFGYFPAFTVI